MPVNSSGRKHLTELVVAEGSFSDDTATNFMYDTVTAGDAGVLSIEPIGTPMIWDNGDSRFELYIAQVVATVKATGGSPLSGGSVLALSAGEKEGKGLNKADIDIGTADVPITVLYRGDAQILNSGIEWGATSAPNQALYLAELALQRIAVASEAQAVTPTYTS